MNARHLSKLESLGPFSGDWRPSRFFPFPSDAVVGLGLSLSRHLSDRPACSCGAVHRPGLLCDHFVPALSSRLYPAHCAVSDSNASRRHHPPRALRARLLPRDPSHEGGDAPTRPARRCPGDPRLSHAGLETQDELLSSRSRGLVVPAGVLVEPPACELQLLEVASASGCPCASRRR